MPEDPYDVYRARFLHREPSSEDCRQLVEVLWEAWREDVFLEAYSRIRNREDAKDICQDTFVNAMSWLVRRGGVEVSQLNFPAWLCRIARNLAVTKLRRQRLEKGWSIVERALPDNPDPIDSIVSEEMVRFLRQCIEELPDSKRQVVVLRDIDGMSSSAVATKLKRTVGSVRVTLHRARKALRECMESKEIVRVQRGE